MKKKMAKWMLKATVSASQFLLFFPIFRNSRWIASGIKEPVYLTKSSDLADFLFYFPTPGLFPDFK